MHNTRNTRRLLPASRVGFLTSLLFVLCACGGADSTGAVTQVAQVTFTAEPNRLMAVGDSQQISIRIADAAGATLGNVVAEWSSGNSAVASVNSTGMITALSTGATTITATASGKSASFPLEIVAVDGVSAVSLTSSDDIFEVGAVKQLSIAVRDRNGKPFPQTPAMRWSTPRSNIARISNSGVLTIIGTDNDSLEVTATFGNKTGRFRFFAWPSLVSGTETNVSAVADESRWFLVRTTSSTARLTVTLAGGTGDPDLSIWSPGTWDDAAQVCSSISPTSAESCVLENPAPGLWSIEVFGFATFGNARLKAVVTPK